ncbi:MAG TPA: carbohydrate kinase family protein [Tepidisphaeraceae bacterium]|jgi:sugar/nucleoside kinase (ribokinase family)|nr:carbohydrate kinase family protein [Tepidisphaeraceae bacterium]
MDAALFGLIVADVIGEPVDLRHPPAPGGLELVRSITLTTGGNVCNTGVAMAKLGMSVAAAGLVGEDVLGAAVVDRLKHAGVDTSSVFTTAAAQTSATMVAVEPGGERVFFHTPGATTLLNAAAFRRCFPIFSRCRWVQVGYFGLLPALTPDLPALLQELRAFTPATRIGLDTVNPPGRWDLLEPILPHLDLFAPSRTEAAALTGESDPEKMVAVFRKKMKCGLIGVKLDADGCFLDDGHRSVFAPSYKIDVIDTTGAGDTWFGGMLTGLCKEMPVEQCAKFANRAAADCCTALGASAGVRTFEQTLARI